MSVLHNKSTYKGQNQWIIGVVTSIIGSIIVTFLFSVFKIDLAFINKLFNTNNSEFVLYIFFSLILFLIVFILIIIYKLVRRKRFNYNRNLVMQINDPINEQAFKIAQKINKDNKKADFKRLIKEINDRNGEITNVDLEYFLENDIIQRETLSPLRGFNFYKFTSIGSKVKKYI